MGAMMFVAGLLIGSLCGVVMMCLLQVSRQGRREEDRDEVS